MSASEHATCITECPRLAQSGLVIHDLGNSSAPSVTHKSSGFFRGLPLNKGMGRPLSDAHRAAFIDQWRQTLLDGCLDTAAVNERRVLFAALLGLSPNQRDQVDATKLSQGLKALMAAIASDRARAKAGDEWPALDTWVVRHLLTAGGNLLITEEVRAAWVARIRDSDRRHRHAQEGMHASRIELPVEIWDKLRRLPTKRRKPTVADRLVDLINAAIEGERKKEHQASATKKAARSKTQEDLFRNECPGNPQG